MMNHHKARYPAFVLIFFTIITLLALPKTSTADGMYFKQILVPDSAEVSKLIHSPEQKAIIVWDTETKMERMIISTTAKSEDLANLCWLVPIKSITAPTVKECDFDIFTDIAREFAPKVWVSYYSVYGYGMGYGYSSAMEIPGVVEINFEEIDVYDIHILYVTDAGDLIQWLEDHDFFVPDGAQGIFNEYAKDGCYFVANRIDLVNKHADLMNALETYVSDVLADLLGEEVTIDQVIEQIIQRIKEDAQSSVSYDTSVASYFFTEAEYDQLGYSFYLSLVSSVKERISSKFSGLKKTVSDLRSGVATPLLFEFSPSLEIPVYPLYLTSLVPEDIHIEVYVIAPYRVTDLNGILTHDPPLTESDYAELDIPSQEEYYPYWPPISYYNHYIPKYEIEEDYKVFLNLTHALRYKITEHYDIPLPQGDLWGTRMVYKGKAEGLICDAMFGDILMKGDDDTDSRKVDLFEMGPLYAQIFEPYYYIFVADYTGPKIKVLGEEGNIVECSSIFRFMLDPENFFQYGDPNDPNDEVYQYYVNELGADPNLFGENDPNVADALDLPFFIVDFSLPVFADPNLRFGGHQVDCIKGSGTLGWSATVHDYGANGIQSFLLEPLSTDPYDGMPTYLPAYYDAIDAALLYGRPSFPPQAVQALEAALWNSGISDWPNVAALYFTPQYFEDLTVTIEVTNGVHSDVRTIPMSVVNYPVENYAPVLQLHKEFYDSLGSKNVIFYVGEVGEYLMDFLDPDCFVFSQAYNLNGQKPATSHAPSNTPDMTPRDDMSKLVWNMTSSDLPSYYQFGPWIPSPWWSPYPLNQHTGLISWVPNDEGVYDIVIICSDNRGGSAFVEATIECIHRHSKTSYHQTQIPPTIYLNPRSTDGLLGPSVSTNDPFGYPNIYPLNRLNTINPIPVPFSYSGFSNTQNSTLQGDMGAAYGIVPFPELMPWWAY